MNKFLLRCAQVGLPAAMFASQLGCQHGVRPLAPAPQPLGSVVDQINMTQESNAELSKYVVYVHEFKLNTDEQPGWRLNDFGEDHVKQIAANLRRGDDYLVVVERSRTSIKPGTEYELPLHYNDELDRTRRRVIVAALTALGVNDAETRVVVAPAFAEGLNAQEAAGANQRGAGGGGFGGGFGGGLGGFGGFGGFGGGFQ